MLDVDAAIWLGVSQTVGKGWRFNVIWRVVTLQLTVLVLSHCIM